MQEAPEEEGEGACGGSGARGALGYHRTATCDTTYNTDAPNESRRRPFMQALRTQALRSAR